MTLIIPILINFTCGLWGWKWRVKALESINFTLQTELQANNDYEAKVAFNDMNGGADNSSAVSSSIAAKRLQQIKQLYDSQIINDAEFSELREKYAQQV